MGQADSREDLLAASAAKVRAAMNSPEEIRKGLEGITAEDLHSPQLAEILRRTETLDPDVMNREIWNRGIGS